MYVHRLVLNLKLFAFKSMVNALWRFNQKRKANSEHIVKVSNDKTLNYK